MSDFWTKLSGPMRKMWVFGFYRWIIGVSFLFAAFDTFPSAAWAIGLGYLVFNAGVEAILLVTELQANVANLLSDAAERKTRHTIVMAAERGGFGADQEDFWWAVERRVAAEQEPVEPTGFWKGAGLAVGALTWRLLASVFGIGLVMALSGN